MTEKQILNSPHVAFKLFMLWFRVYLIPETVKIWRCLRFCMLQRLKENNLSCTQPLKRCTVLAGRLAKYGQGCKSWCPASTCRRRKQKVIVYPLEDDRATVWHGQANNEFSWERNQSRSGSLLTLTHFIPAKMSIVYLLLFAFALKSRNSFFFPDVPLCYSSSWKQIKAAATALPASVFTKRHRRRPLHTITHKETKTLSSGALFIPPSVGFPCFQNSSLYWGYTSWSQWFSLTFYSSFLSSKLEKDSMFCSLWSASLKNT